MARLQPNFNWGSELRNDNPNLYNQLSLVYSLIAEIVNSKSTKHQSTEDPKADSQTNKLFDIGDIWVNTVTNTAWIMTSRTSNTVAVWTQIT